MDVYSLDLSTFRDAKAAARSTQKRIAEQENAVIQALRMVYFIVENNLLNSLFKDLKKLCIEQGVTTLNTLEVDKHTNDESWDSVQDFLTAISGVDEEDVITDFKNCLCYSMLIDESTDIHVDQNLLIYIRLSGVSRLCAFSK